MDGGWGVAAWGRKSCRALVCVRALLGLHLSCRNSEEQPNDQKHICGHKIAPPRSTFAVRSRLASLQMAEVVKSKLIATPSPITKRPKRRVRVVGKGAAGLRPHLIALLLLAPAASGLGCASQDQATKAAEHAGMESEDDATCRQKGAAGSPAYVDCRKSLAAEKAKQGAVQEQKRRDFDRVLGAGTDGQSNY